MTRTVEVLQTPLRAIVRRTLPRVSRWEGAGTKARTCCLQHLEEAVDYQQLLEGQQGRGKQDQEDPSLHREVLDPSG